MKYLNEIRVNANGEATVFGDLAHAFWNYGKGGYPRKMSGSHGFFVFQAVNNGVREHFQIVASQPTRELALAYTAPYCVLVCCDAPDDSPSISDMGRKVDGISAPRSMHCDWAAMKEETYWDKTDGVPELRGRLERIRELFEAATEPPDNSYGGRPVP